LRAEEELESMSSSPLTIEEPNLNSFYEHELGGIDLNPNILDLEEPANQYHFSPNLNFQLPANINGAYPIIFNVEPITNVQVLFNQS